jgi:hypothetical protein
VGQQGGRWRAGRPEGGGGRGNRVPRAHDEVTRQRRVVTDGGKRSDAGGRTELARREPERRKRY